MAELEREFDRTRAHQFRLEFEYPDEARKKELRIVNRDLTRIERTKVTKKVDELASVVEALESGDVRLEDLPAKLRDRLRALLL